MASPHGAFGHANRLRQALEDPRRVLVEPPPVDRRRDSADPPVYEDGEAGPGGWNKARPPEHVRGHFRYARV